MTAIRKTKEEKPVLAICRDFYKTLSPYDKQAQGYIKSVCDGDISSFRKGSSDMAKADKMDTNLAYMYKIVSEARGSIVLTKKSMREYEEKGKLFPGIEEWFERIKLYGAEHDVIAEHYIISLGLKE